MAVVTKSGHVRTFRSVYLAAVPIRTSSVFTDASPHPCRMRVSFTLRSTGTPGASLSVRPARRLAKGRLPVFLSWPFSSSLLPRLATNTWKCSFSSRVISPSTPWAGCASTRTCASTRCLTFLRPPTLLEPVPIAPKSVPEPVAVCPKSAVSFVEELSLLCPTELKRSTDFSLERPSSPSLASFLESLCNPTKDWQPWLTP